MSHRSPELDPRIIVGVPGPWRSPGEVADSLHKGSRGWSLLSHEFLSEVTGRRFELELYDFDPDLRSAFAVAGGSRVTDSDLEAVDSHVTTAYVLAHERGREVVNDLIDVSAALLEAGGHAVKIESSGLAHGREAWIEFAHSTLKDFRSVDFMVAYVGDAEKMCSCGMHSFELPDATASRVADEDLLTTLSEFNRYAFRESPEFRDGHTFQLAADAPVFELRRQQYTLYPAGDLFHNPFGAWRLTRRLE